MLLQLRLSKVFKDGFLPNGSLTGSSCDISRDEVKPFHGKSWDQLSDDFVLDNWSALATFNPQAFSYYLPAFLKVLVNTCDTSVSFFEAMLYFLDFDSPTTSDVDRKGRWENYNDEQIQVIIDILDYVSRNDDCLQSVQDDIKNAKTALELRLWNH